MSAISSRPSNLGTLGWSPSTSQALSPKIPALDLFPLPVASYKHLQNSLVPTVHTQPACHKSVTLMRASWGRWRISQARAPVRALPAVPYPLHKTPPCTSCSVLLPPWVGGAVCGDLSFCLKRHVRECSPHLIICQLLLTGF